MDYTRQLDIFNPYLNRDKVVVIGAGGIGSPTVLALAKMGISDIEVFDFDKIDDVNLPSQFYRISDVGKFKVDALKEICKDFADVDITVHRERFDISLINQPCYIISAVDNMAARKEIWDMIKYSPFCKKYIDCRMGAERLKIHIVNPVDMESIKLYESTLIDDSEAVQLPCTAKAIIYNVMMTASQVAHLIRCMLLDHKIPYKYNVYYDFVSGIFLQDSTLI